MGVVLIVFVILAGIVSIFSLVVVITDLVHESKNTAQTVQPEPAKATEAAEAAAPKQASEEVCASEAVKEAPDDSVIIADENAIVFSAGEQKTLDEKFQDLDEQSQRYYVEIVQYAMGQEGAKQYKNARYEEYKIRKTRLVRMQIKRGVVICEFILLNENFRNYIQDNKVRVRQAPTVLRIEDETAVSIAKSSIDIAVKAAQDEQEYKKQKRKEKRRLARQREKEQENS